MMPKVSVLMAVYNSQQFLSEAIESILTQTFTDFEFLIINDGSTDQSEETIASFAKKDDRIRIIINEVNIGLTKSLNRGLSIARGEYIARMDADDISLPSRFEKQVDFLDTHPDVWVVGGQVEFVDDQGDRKQAHLYPMDEKIIRWNAVTNGPTMIHPAVMTRREKLKLVGDYPEDCTLAQDAALWRKFYMFSNFPLANLGDELILYRQQSDSLGRVSRTEQVETVTKYQALFYQHILDEEIAEYCVQIINFPSRYRYSSVQAKASIDLLLRLFSEFRYRFSLDARQLAQMKKDIGRKIFMIAYRYPIGCMSHILYSIYCYPAVIKDYIHLYTQWLGKKLEVDKNQKEPFS